MPKFNVLSFIFLAVALVGFIFSKPEFTGNFISVGGDNPNFFGLLTIISFALFLITFLSGKRLEAILVPTGSDEADRERALKGAKYYHAHEKDEPYVLISGSTDEKPFVSSQPGHIYKYMRRDKVPRGSFLFEPKSKNTAENVVYSAEVIRKKGIRTVDVVSNPSHLWRFRFLFDKAREEGLIDEDVRINYIPTRRNFLFEDVKDAVYGITHYLYYLFKWGGKPLKSVKIEK